MQSLIGDLMTIYETMLGFIRRELRERTAESRYKTALGAGMRQESVKAVEDGKGSAESFAQYLEYVCRTYPEFAYKMFYSLALIVAKYGDERTE